MCMPVRPGRGTEGSSSGVGVWGRLGGEPAHRVSPSSMVAGGESLEWTHRSIIITSRARCSTKT